MGIPTAMSRDGARVLERPYRLCDLMATNENDLDLDEVYQHSIIPAELVVLFNVQS